MGNNQSSTGERRSGLRSRSSTVSSLASRVVPTHHSSASQQQQQHQQYDSGSSKPIDVKKQVDGGWVEPQTLLYSRIDYSRPTVHRLIAERRLAPFYLGLQDYEEEWDVDEIIQALHEAEQQATQNLRDAHAAATETANEAEASQLSAPVGTRKHKDAVGAFNAAVLHRERLAEMIRQREKRGGGALQLTDKSQHARQYRGNSLECPICFLYYPSNMVHTRCCDQPICTECFIQIKRADPTPTHLESEPAACPFCMETNFGCVYEKPTAERPTIEPTSSDASGSSMGSAVSPASASEERRPRRKSFAHTEKEVVTTDMVHPDWEAKVEQMKAIVARRANRRIVFRQVGDRLIPVGITSGRGGDGSAPTMATTSLPANFLSQLAAALDASNESGSSGGRRRSRGSRRRSNDEMTSLLESLGLGGGSDIEELMVQEAMRLSQLEEEERQKKAQAEEGSRAVTPAPEATSSSSTRVEANPATEQMLSEAMSGTFAGSLPAATATQPSARAGPSSSQHPASGNAVLLSSSPSETVPHVLAPITQSDLDLPSTPEEPVAEPLPVAQKSSESPRADQRPDLPGPSVSFASTASSTSATSVSPSQGYLQLPEEEESLGSSPTQSKHTSEHLGTASNTLVNI
ncbi:hypothetical protein JCM10908_004227 [Rhodotorula pacifica]|uniref:Sip5p n=1 Tax=Rhodotorula pacifica TaxID=1495444 RepID=UPI0031702F89